MSANKNKEITVEYQVQDGQGIDEIFPTQREAESYLHDMGKDQQMSVQFFSKEWIWNESRSVWQEHNVTIIKNYGEHL